MYHKAGALLGATYAAVIVRPLGPGAVSEIQWLEDNEALCASTGANHPMMHLAGVRLDWPRVEVTWATEIPEGFRAWKVWHHPRGGARIAFLNYDGTVCHRTMMIGDSMVDETLCPSPSAWLRESHDLEIGYHDGYIIYAGCFGLEVLYSVAGQRVFEVSPTGKSRLRAWAISADGRIAYAVDDKPIIVHDIRRRQDDVVIPGELVPWQNDQGERRIGLADQLAFAGNCLVIGAHADARGWLHVYDLRQRVVRTPIQTGLMRVGALLSAHRLNHFVAWGATASQCEGDMRHCGLDGVLGQSESFHAGTAAISPTGEYLAFTNDNLLYVGETKQIFRPLY